ncbi:MAG: SpoIVB peptidase [Oscillospiraceae bacterium]
MIFKKIKNAAAAAMLIAAALILSGGAFAAELPTELVPVGQAVGISIKTQGVIVSELSEMETENGRISPAKDAGILPGDVITMVNGVEVCSTEDMVKALEKTSDGPIAVRLTRDGEERQVTVTPYCGEDENFLGVWVRDSLTGIGTVTYYDPESGTFGALGHSISDSETGLIIPLREGEIMPAHVTGVTAGKSGTPGQLGGAFDYDNVAGEITKNCQVGIFGTTTGDPFDNLGEKLPVAAENEIKVGKAVILSAAGGNVEEYEVEVTRIYSDNTDGRCMMIKVTDDKLIALTGGIVQGMSGSPLIQNGKLIGAVTHVLINDPQKGYAVSIEDMLEAAA